MEKFIQKIKIPRLLFQVTTSNHPNVCTSFLLQSGGIKLFLLPHEKVSHFSVDISHSPTLLLYFPPLSSQNFLSLFYLLNNLNVDILLTIACVISGPHSKRFSAVTPLSQELLILILVSPVVILVPFELLLSVTKYESV
jgi:hypothetical protein